MVLILALAAWWLSGCAYYHVIEPGDTLYKLSKDYGVSVQEIQQQNPGIDPYNLEIGQRVKIPRFANQVISDYSDRPDRPKPKPKPKPEPKPEPEPTPKPEPPKPIVEPPAKQPEPAPAKADKTPFIWPVPGGKLIARFGQGNDGVVSHGVEIAAPEGSPVLAAAAGKVIVASDEFKTYGNMIVIRHDNNFFSIYAFNKRLMVKKGDDVKQGQKIAEVGRTGQATAPMLHFQMRIGSKAVDPLPHLPKQ
jgi:lipoprotein NlpD